jgi:hypothetical protein
MTPDAVRITGEGLVLLAFDIGRQVNLEQAAARLEGGTRPRTIRGRRRAPAWFGYDPPPLHLVVGGDPVDVGGGGRTEPDATIIVHDFGAAVVTYRVPLPPTLAELPPLATALYEHAALERDARARLGRLMDAMGPAIERPAISAAVEDYVVWCLRGWEEPPHAGGEPRGLLERHRSTIARIIEAEEAPLAAEQIRRSTQAVMGYGPGDLAVIDWNAAVLLDPEPEDVVAVLQHANVELLELRILDGQLDRLIESADEALARVLRRRLWPSFAERRMLGAVAAAQSDAAVGFEGVHNAIKLTGTQYLARLHRLAAEQLGLPDWTAAVERKLAAGAGLHGRIADTVATRRLEVLEWVIVVLIAVSIVLPFLPWY